MNDSPHVVIAHWRADVIGGAEIATMEFVDGLRPEFRFTMLIPGEGSLARFYRGKGVDVWVRDVQTRRRLFPGLHWFQSRLLAREFGKRKVAVVLCNTLPAYGRVGDAAHLKNVPCCVFLRDHPRPETLHGMGLDRSDSILAVSLSVKKLAEATLGTGFTVAHVPDHLDVERVLVQAGEALDPDLADLLSGQAEAVVAMVGRIQEVKQQHVFLEAARIVLDQRPNIRFWIIGGASARDEPYYQSVLGMVRTLGLGDSVVFSGHISSVPAVLARADICCVPSRMEAFPRAVLEAQAVGTPVVAGAVGGIPEIVIDRQTGLLFDSVSERAATDLAERLLSLLGDSQLRRVLAENAKEHVVRLFAEGQSIRRFERVLSAAVSGGAGRWPK